VKKTAIFKEGALKSEEEKKILAELDSVKRNRKGLEDA
jgi:hypothetical protein